MYKRQHIYKKDGLRRPFCSLYFRVHQRFFHLNEVLRANGEAPQAQLQILQGSMARSMKEVHTINYYPINEGAARRAKEMNSFSDYKEGLSLIHI